MAMIPIALATEDVLSEAIGLRLIAEIEIPHSAPMKLRRGGSGYLRSKMDSWRQMAQHQMMVVLTDLDRANCLLEFRNQWLGPRLVPENLLFRIAVREVEAWILADHVAMRTLIGAKGVLPEEPDLILDPKQHLLELAKRAPREVRNDLIRAEGANAIQGLGYNSRLVSWVRTRWNPERASKLSPSLRRTRIRLREAAEALNAKNG